MRLWSHTTLAMPIRISGRTQVSHWSVGRRSPRHAGSSNRGERGLEEGRAGSGFSIRLGLTSVKLLDWRQTCETVI